MTSITSSSLRRRVGVLSGAVCVASLCLLGSAGTAAADEFMPAATLTVDPVCIEGSFYLDIVMGNVAGLDTAHFVATLNTGNTAWNAIEYDVPAGATEVNHVTGAEGALVTVHITSADATPAIDYSIEFTADCIEDSTIPETTVPETTVPETTAVDSSGGGLPSTGSSSGPLAGVAALLLLAGIALTRSTRSTRRA